jgi:protein TonB
LLGSSSFINFLILLVVSLSHGLLIVWMLTGKAVEVGDFTPRVLSVNFIQSSREHSSQKKSTTKASSNLSSLTGEMSKGSPAEYQNDASESSNKTGGRFNRQIIHSPKPHYPLASKALREQGLVVVKLCVNPRGLVDTADISRSSGSHALDHSALKALVQWTFAQIDSNSMNTSLQCFLTPVQFTLEG